MVFKYIDNNFEYQHTINMIFIIDWLLCNIYISSSFRHMLQTQLVDFLYIIRLNTYLQNLKRTCIPWTISLLFEQYMYNQFIFITDLVPEYSIPLYTMYFNPQDKFWQINRKKPVSKATLFNVITISKYKHVNHPLTFPHVINKLTIRPYLCKKIRKFYTLSLFKG